MIFTTCKCEKKFHFKTVYIWCASWTDEVELLRTLCLCTFRLVLPKVQLSRPIVVVVLSFLRADNYWIMFIGVLGADRDVESSALFIQTLFVSQNRQSSKVVYPHFTTATNTTNIQVVFEVLVDTILKENLSSKQYILW